MIARRTVLGSARFIIVASVTAALLLVAAPAPDASAQGSKEDRSAARSKIKSGDEKLSRGDRALRRGKKLKAQEHFRAALVDYNKAYDLYPDNKIFYAVAQAEERLGLYLDAHGHYQEVLTDKEDLSDQLRSLTEERLAEVRENLSVIAINILPEGSTLIVDGVEVGVAPLAEPHYVNPGEHEIKLTKEGFKDREETLELEAGDVHDKTYELEKIATKPKKKKKKKPRVAKKRADTGPAKWPLYGGIGLTLAMAVGATTTGLMAVGKQSTFDDDTEPLDVREAAADSGKSLALTTDLLLVGTVVVGGLTAYYYFGVYKKSKGNSSERSALWITPTVSGTTAGVAAGGSF